MTRCQVPSRIDSCTTESSEAMTRSAPAHEVTRSAPSAEKRSPIRASADWAFRASIAAAGGALPLVGGEHQLAQRLADLDQPRGLGLVEQLATEIEIVGSEPGRSLVGGGEIVGLATDVAAC